MYYTVNTGIGYIIRGEKSYMMVTNDIYPTQQIADEVCDEMNAQLIDDLGYEAIEQELLREER
jgi:hypothetical protein